mmetsp:Transcript_9323/g.34512  ORF Transcript_9323/g.34512 Transcript_9323/m.34512 type:complete len:90 (-) Transcript_9323:3552-3821(-)
MTIHTSSLLSLQSWGCWSSPIESSPPFPERSTVHAFNFNVQYIAILDSTTTLLQDHLHVGRSLSNLFRGLYFFLISATLAMKPGTGFAF